tara:strand:+ start:2674 stop:4812 length:2139 start_codon:yes stop_codon:yes gene_type:complete
MAKGINLFQGADPTIATAAYRAGKGNVPKDLSKTFSGIATSYSKMLAEFGKQGAAIGQQVGKLLVPLVGQAVEIVQNEMASPNMKGADDVGQEVIDHTFNGYIDPVTGDKVEGLVPQWKESRKQMWAMRKEYGKDSEEYRNARTKYKTLKKESFRYLDAIRSKKLFEVGKTGQGNINQQALANMPDGVMKTVFQMSFQNSGKKIKAGENVHKNLVGIYTAPIVGEDNEIKLALFKDGKAISGIDSQYNIQYTDKSDIEGMKQGLNIDQYYDAEHVQDPDKKVFGITDPDWPGRSHEKIIPKSIFIKDGKKYFLWGTAGKWVNPETWGGLVDGQGYVEAKEILDDKKWGKTTEEGWYKHDPSSVGEEIKITANEFLQLREYTGELMKAKTPDKKNTIIIQRELEILGYDIGPDRADARWGKNTQAAWDLFKKDLATNEKFKAASTEQRTSFNVDLDDISTMLPYERTETRNVFEAARNDVAKNAAKGGVFDKDNLKNGLLKSLKTPADIVDLSNARVGSLSQTFSQYMNSINEGTAMLFFKSNPHVVKYLQDIDGGGLTMSDVSFEPGSAGYNNFQNAIKEAQNDPNALVDWYVDHLETDVHDKHFKQKGSSSDSGDEKTTYQMPVAGGNPMHVDKSLIDPQVKLMNEDPENIPQQTGWNGVDWKKVNGEYKVWDLLDNNKMGWKPITKEQLRLNLEFAPRVGYKITKPADIK